MKDKNMKIFFILTLLSLSMVTIKCQATDFTIFPEDAETPGSESIFKTIGESEKILAAVQFGKVGASSSNKSKDARDNLQYNRVFNVIIFYLKNLNF